MSLRLKLILLFAAILFVTSGVSALVGAQLAKRQVQDEIRARTIESGRAIITEIGEARRSSSLDPVRIRELVQLSLSKHSGLNALELAVEHTGGYENIYRVTHGPSGPEFDMSTRDTPEKRPEKKKREEDQIADGPDGRYWVIAFSTKAGSSDARLTLEASLAEADALAATERQTFWRVTFGGAVLLIVAAQLLVSRFIGRPITRMTEAMAQVESGRLDVEAPVGAGPEFDLLARGFNTMLSRIRGFNKELTERVEQATSDLNRKNHDLVEINDLLVATRRDLTAKERLAALGQLAGTIAHELGNPLNSISGHVQLLERRPDLPPPVRNDLRLVSSEVRRMTDVIRRFLDSTRGLRPAPESVDLTTLIGEAIDVSLSAEARGRLMVSRHIETDLSAVVTDPSLVRHVLTNLIANAVDAMPQGGTISVSASAVDGELRLAVRDTGTGITPEDRRRIFDPFYTTKARGKGTGLGLAICREIAVALKGRIDVETEVGKGSAFVLAVPLQRAGDSEPARLLPAELAT